MEHSFWHDKWEKNQLGFHLNDVHPLLKKYFDLIFSSAGSVFIPLCGKTLDMRFLLSQQKSIIGCELSEIAIKSFFQKEIADNSLKTESNSEFLIYSTFQDNCTSKIFVGDYFKLQNKNLSSCSAIYDRASLIALPKDVRAKYVEHIKNLIPKAKMLLITLDYDQSLMEGPPFSVDQAEVNDLFSFATVEVLKRSNIIDDEPNFKSKGHKAFYQTAYFIEWDLAS